MNIKFIRNGNVEIYRGEGSEFPGIGSIPCAVDDLLLCVWAHFKRIAHWIHGASFNLPDFVPDADESLAEAIHLVLILGFGRFDHEASSNWETHRRSVET